MNTAKTFTVVVAVWACLPTLRLQADMSMQILGETYHVSGRAYYDFYYYEEGIDYGVHEDLSYDRTSSSPPVSGNVATTAEVYSLGERVGPLYASSTATRYAQTMPVDEEHSLDVTVFRVEQNAGPYKAFLFYGGPDLRVGAAAQAELTVDFRLPGSDKTVQLATDYSSPSAYNYSLAVLTDLEAEVSQTLFFGGYYEGPDIEPVTAVDLCGTHTYRLEMYVHGPCLGPSALTLGMLEVSVAPAPVPGAVLLGTIGLTCAGRRLRRRLR